MQKRNYLQLNCLNVCVSVVYDSISISIGNMSVKWLQLKN